MQPTILASTLFGTPVSIDGASGRLHDLGAVREGPAWLIVAVRTDRGVGLLVDGATAGLEATAGELRADLTWLREAIFDRQIVDLDGRRVIRVSDVVLRRHDGVLTVEAVDVGAAALFRRLGLARIAARFEPKLLAIDRLHVPGAAAEALLLDESRPRLEELATKDVTNVLTRLPVDVAEHAVRHSRHRGAIHDHHRRRRRKVRRYRRVAP